MLTVKNYFFDNEDDLWADIHCNGRRQWYTVVGCDKDDPLYQKVMELDEVNETETALRLIEKHCREHSYEKMMAKLPHIEDASKPMQEAWYGADAGDGPFSGAGYYLDDKQFKEEYGMTVEEFDEQIENDIAKHGIDSEIFERRYNDDCLYSVTWWLCEYFTEAVVDD